jgi:hypothetical protein
MCSGGHFTHLMNDGTDMVRQIIWPFGSRRWMIEYSLIR